MTELKCIGCGNGFIYWDSIGPKIGMKENFSISCRRMRYSCEDPARVRSLIESEVREAGNNWKPSIVALEKIPS